MPLAAPTPRIARRMACTIPRRIPSIKSPTKRRQNPARGPDAFPVAGGPAACGGGGYMATEMLLSDE
jgi:hypothetical protein